LYHIFISHAWGYSSHYETIKNWINNDRYLSSNWSDYSIPVYNPVDAHSKRELKQKITNKINLSNVVIILAGMYATHSEWIDYEIDEAVRLGKYIIGVRPWGQERMPVKIQSNANVMVGWNSSSVIAAIKSK